MTGRPVLVGISACLLGQRVRYDGRDKLARDLVSDLGKHVRWVPVCPEVELGLGVPREPIQLERHGESVHLVAPGSGKDHTESMLGYARARCAELEALGLSGYVWKKNSPSCGHVRVKVFEENRVRRNGRGLFAKVLMERFPDLPVTDEARLADAAARRRFLARVLAHRRASDFFSGAWTVESLVRFHARERRRIRASDPAREERLARVVARAGKLAPDEVARRYRALLVK